jgi:hypothetical protein
MSRRLPPIVALCVSLAVLSAPPARATTLVPADLNELTASALAIAYVRIVDVRAVTTDDRRRVETVVVAESLGYLKGNIGPTIVFRVPGGQVGAYRTVMVGAPSFSVGEEAVLFFGARGPALPYLVGFSQGVFRVQSDPRTGSRMVVPAPALNAGATAAIARGTRPPMPLEAFAAHVRALAAGSAR